MNIYVVTEGKTEAIVYRYWIPIVNPSLRQIHNPEEDCENGFYIISAKGYPYYFDAIDGAIAEINHYRRFSRLVVTVDSEDMTKEEKRTEVMEHLASKKCNVEVRVVIQHFCFETWALGNRKVIRKNPSSQRLLEYKRMFDVRVKDPELLPGKPDESLNRSQFAEKYLRLALNDRFRGLTYDKGNPRVLIHQEYFSQIRSRLSDTGHVSSFSDFLAAFL